MSAQNAMDEILNMYTKGMQIGYDGTYTNSGTTASGLAAGVNHRAVPFQHDMVFNQLKKKYPNLQEITVHEKEMERLYIFRMKFEDTFYEAHVPWEQLKAINKTHEIIFWLDKFISESIQGVAKPAKKKRKTISKKQRELKKEWVL